MRKLKKRLKMLRAALLAAVVAAGLLCGCGSGDSPETAADFELNMYDSEDAIEDITLAVTSNYTTLNPYRVAYGNEISLFLNLYDGLVSYNSDSELIPAIAEAWEASDDYMTWTFHLRDDVYWVNYKGEKMDRIVADDFVTGVEWCLNYAKNEATNYLMLGEHVAGAMDYLEYTMELSEEEAMAVPRETFLEMVGIEAPDDRTLIYHMANPCVFFPSVTANMEFMPLSASHVEEIGRDAAVINSVYTAWYSGAYLLTDYIPDNSLILDANPLWYGNAEHTRFRSVTYRIVESTSIAYQLYRTGEIDYVTLYQSQIHSIITDPDNKWNEWLVETIPDMYLYQKYFNFRKYNDDGTEDEQWNRAAGNEAFRLSWYYGYDNTEDLKEINSIDPMSCEIETVTPRNTFFLSDGTDYVDLVEEYLGLADKDRSTIRRLDRDLFEKYKAQAIEELTAQGVTFPIELDVYINASDQKTLNSALMSKASIEKALGADYINYTINTYTSSYYTEVLLPQKNSTASAAWASDFGDPTSILFQHIYDPAAFEVDYYMNICDYTEEELNGEWSYMREVVEEFKTYTELYEKASAIVDDIDERYRAFAEAEAYMIRHVLTLPIELERSWCLTRIDVTSYCQMGFSCFRDRMVDVRTDKNGYKNDIWEE